VQINSAACLPTMLPRVRVCLSVDYKHEPYEKARTTWYAVWSYGIRWGQRNHELGEGLDPTGE